MKYAEALQHGLGYAAGREDASAVVTVSPDTRGGFHAFAEAFATAWAEYEAGERSYMTNAESAYDTWQRTAGQSIWAR